MDTTIKNHTKYKQERELWSWLPQPVLGGSVVLYSLAYTAIATLIGIGLASWLPFQSLGLLYILAVVVAAIGFGMAMGLAVAAMSFLAYNFFFIPPVYTFTIADPRELFALFVFLGVAVLTGSLAGRMRTVANAAKHRAVALHSLNVYAETLSACRDQIEVLMTLARQAALTIDGQAVVLLVGGEKHQIAAWWPKPEELSSADVDTARRASRSGLPAPAVASGWQGSSYTFYPLIPATKSAAVLGIMPSHNERRFSVEIERSLQGVIRHAAIAIDRIALERETADALNDAERERLRSALLSSLSHDLRTPLASIVGSVTSLRSLGKDMSPETRDDLLLAIEEEAGRLTRYVNNLLNMTRLETGDFNLTSDWVDLAEMVQSAMSRARQLSPASDIKCVMPSPVAAIKANAPLLESVIFNLLDNAIKFSGAIPIVRVKITNEGDTTRLTVTDYGQGIPPQLHVKIFEPFFRSKDIERTIAGTGLGLTIAKRFIEGMGGTITITSPLPQGQGNGTQVEIALKSPTGPSVHPLGGETVS